MSYLFRLLWNNSVMCFTEMLSAGVTMVQQEHSRRLRLTGRLLLLHFSVYALVEFLVLFTWQSWSTAVYISFPQETLSPQMWPRDDGVLSLSLVLIYAIRNPFVFHFPRDLWSFSENVFKGFRKTFNCLKYRRREANMLQQFDTTLVF